MIYRRLSWPTKEPQRIIPKYRREGPTEFSWLDWIQLVGLTHRVWYVLLLLPYNWPSPTQAKYTTRHWQLDCTKLAWGFIHNAFHHLKRWYSTYYVNSKCRHGPAFRQCSNRQMSALDLYLYQQGNSPGEPAPHQCRPRRNMGPH